MARCQRIQIPKRQICIGDLGNRIDIFSRDLQPPDFDGVDAAQAFVSVHANLPSAIITVSGNAFFNGAEEGDLPITHEIWIRYVADVTSENWIEFTGNRLRILRAENVEERNEWLKMICTNLGDLTKESTEA